MRTKLTIARCFTDRGHIRTMVGEVKIAVTPETEAEDHVTERKAKRSEDPRSVRNRRHQRNTSEEDATGTVSVL